MTNHTYLGPQSYSSYFTELIAISQATQDILITNFTELIAISQATQDILVTGILVIVLLLVVILIIKLI